MKLTWTISFLLTTALLTQAALAWAQAPRVSSVYPPVVRRGEGGAVTLTGENLKPVSRVLVSGEGMTATVAPEGGGASLTVRLAVTADVRCRVLEARLWVRTAPRTRPASPWEWRLRWLSQRERNRTISRRRRRHWKESARDRLRTDRDAGRRRRVPLPPTAGEIWVFELGSDSHGSSLDGLLSLRDASGRELATVVKTQAQDARLVHTFEAGGEYHDRGARCDVSGRARGDVSARRRPACRWSPERSARRCSRGQTTTVQLAGYNLGGMALMAV